jgi:hypothetical protein
MTISPERRQSVAYYALTALSLSIGWGIRGNFGHEYGAMIPGALAAMAAVALSGRVDWISALPFFAVFGALGWSFGGSISYMQVVAYTHSGHSLSVFYGFACLFLIGFLWAALGGAGTALPAVADRARLTDFFLPLGLVFFCWWLQGVLIEPWLRSLGFTIDWYDTDWLAALLCFPAALMAGMIRRRMDRSTALVLYLAGGWWAGFGLLVLGLGLRMTPPRGDNWAGCLGMTVGAGAYCLRYGLPEVARAGLVSGFIGGIGFAAASMLKLIEVKSGYDTNWHSILEQTTGLFNGIGIAVALRGLSARIGAARSDDVSSPSERRWAKLVAVGFVLLLIPYLNLRKNVRDWVRAGAVPDVMYGLSAGFWFDLAFVIVALGVVVLLLRHARRPLAVVPSDPLGQAQGLYLVFMAIMVIGNFERALVAFKDQRLVTEGIIHANAVLCAMILLTSDQLREGRRIQADGPSSPARARWARLLAVGTGSALLAIVIDWAIVRAIYGDQFAGHAGLHIRFGPNATIDSSKGRLAPNPC